MKPILLKLEILVWQSKNKFHLKILFFSFFYRFLSSSSLIYKGKCDTPFPLRWSSPEVLLYQEYSSKSDVWSYGILLWEIFSLGQMPFNDSTTNDMAAKRIKTGQMPMKPSLANENIYKDIIQQCWIFKCDDRPSFSILKEIFKKIF